VRESWKDWWEVKGVDDVVGKKKQYKYKCPWCDKYGDPKSSLINIGCACLVKGESHQKLQPWPIVATIVKEIS